MKKIIGIDLDGTDLSFALLKKQRQGKIEILSTETTSLSVHKECLNVKRLYIYSKASKGKIFSISGLSCNDILIKTQTISVQNKRALKKALPFQREALTHLPKENTLFVSIVEKKEKNAFYVTHYLSTKEALNHSLSSLKEFALAPDFISSIPHALIRYIKALHPEYSSFFLLYIANDKTILISAKNNLLQECFQIEEGQNSIEKTAQLETTSWGKEVKNTLLAFCQSLPEKTTIPLIIFGKVPLQPESLNFFSDMPINPIFHQSEFQSYAIPIGLGLDVLSDDDYSMQLRKKSPKLLKKLGKKMTYYFSMHLLLLIAFFYMNFHCFNQRKQACKDRFFQLEKAETTALTKSSFSTKRVKKALKEIENKIRKENEPPCFLSKAPNVSSVLRWINSLPAIFSKEHVNIQKISYELTEYPSFKKPSKPYIVKIEIKCMLTHPSSYETIKSYLQNESSFIDKRKEIITQALQNNLYLFSFILRPLTKDQIYEQVL